MQTRPLTWTTAVFAVAISLLWGGNMVSLKIALTAVPPFWSAFWRMLLGAIVVATWARARGVSIRPAPGESRLLFGLGALFMVQIALMNAGATWTSPAFGEVIINSHAIFTNLVAHFAIRGERMNAAKSAGLALAFAGLCVVAFGRPDSALAPRPLAGNLVLVASSFLLGVRQVYTRWLVQRVDPARAVVWMMLWSIPMFAAGAWITGEPLSTAPVQARHITALAYQGVVVAGLCFVGWAWLLRQHEAGSVSMFSFLVPFAGITASRILLGETPRAGLLGGAGLAVAGLVLVLRSTQRATVARSSK